MFKSRFLTFGAHHRGVYSHTITQYDGQCVANALLLLLLTLALIHRQTHKRRESTLIVVLDEKMGHFVCSVESVLRAANAIASV